MIRRGQIITPVLLCACGGVLDAPSRPMVCEPPVAVLRSLGPAQCGPTADYIPVNSYQGAITAVAQREDAVVMINGLCTGTLIAAAAGPVVLTAGHCARLEDRVLVVFNFEDTPDGDPLITEGSVIEQSAAPDYAMIRLDTLPAITPTPLATEPGDLLAIVQHPRGRRKVVAEGAYLDSCGGILYYVDLDTLVGSSGAGVLNEEGNLVAVHTDGDCDTRGGGTNYGATAASIVEASPYLDDVDLVDLAH